MKKMWGFAGFPEFRAQETSRRWPHASTATAEHVCTTLDVNELEKRIAICAPSSSGLSPTRHLAHDDSKPRGAARGDCNAKGISGAMLAPMLGRSETSPKLPSNPPPEVALGLAAMKAEESSSALSVPAPSSPKKSGPRASKRSATQAATAAPLNPTAWWSTLQDQFTKIASAAASPPNTTPAKVAKKKAAKRRRKRS